MNKFKTTDTGGLPLNLNDLRFIDASVREAFEGFFSALGITAGTSFRVSGCDVVVTAITDGSNFAWSAGYICLMGEILKVEAGNINVMDSDWQSNRMVYWGLDISYDASGLKIFESSSSHDTYEIRRAKLFFIADVISGYMPYNAPFMLEKMRGVEEPWQPQDNLLNGWANYLNGYGKVSYKKDLFNVVHVKGVAFLAAADTTPIINLPLGYRPLEKRSIGIFEIDTNGDVRAPGGSSINGMEFSFKI